MTGAKIAAAHERYAKAFGNMGAIAPPQLLTEAGLVRLMNMALERGSELTEDEVKKAFPGEDWEEVKQSPRDARGGAAKG
jgi:hypothetical protein